MTARDARRIAGRMRAVGILTIETYRGSGPGGQHRNRTESGIRLVGTWTLNGAPLRLEAQACLKSQHASLRAALAILLSRLRQAIAAAREPARQLTAGFGPDRRVRTYHEPDDRVVDEAGFRHSYRTTVGAGRIGPLVEARRRAILEGMT